MTNPPKKPRGGLDGLIAATRKGEDEPPQSELNAAKPPADAPPQAPKEPPGQ